MAAALVEVYGYWINPRHVLWIWKTPGDFVKLRFVDGSVITFDDQTVEQVVAAVNGTVRPGSHDG
jgi:hypothetical protein